MDLVWTNYFSCIVGLNAQKVAAAIPLICVIGRVQTPKACIQSVNLLMETYCARPRVGVAFHYDVKRKRDAAVNGSKGIVVTSHAPVELFYLKLTFWSSCVVFVQRISGSLESGF